MNSTRKKNLEKLIARFGSQVALAEAASGEHGDIPPNFISQIMTGTRGVGERLARKIEKNLGLPDYSMDREEFTEVVIIKKKTDPKRQALLEIVETLPEAALEWVTFQAKIALTSPAFKGQVKAKKRS